MELQIHNSLGGRKQVFTPIDPQRIKVYVCGPTVYNFVHIGNGRPGVVFDVLIRLLRVLYPAVTFARNITDIDDKINAAAATAGEPIRVLADRFTEAFEQDMAGLGVLPPDIAPRATDHIAEMIEIIEQLIAAGHAYAADGHALFHVPSDPTYGSLSRRSLEDMLDGARVEVAPYKRDAKDFVLWKPSTGDLPGWNSPWGYGRPGWHIECTAMIYKHLGHCIDIHGGGTDLRFPHHENELAQGNCACKDETFVRYWMHNGMLNFGTEKMSKSLGNIVTIRDLLSQYDGEVLRYALLSGHYRSTLGWTDDLLSQAQASLERLYQALAVLGDDVGGDDVGDEGAVQTCIDFQGREASAYPEPVLAALCDDLNTPEALAAMHAIAGRIHKATDLTEARAAQRELLGAGWLLGLLGHTPDEFFRRGATVDERHVQNLVTERETSRKERNFARADELRDELTRLGVELEDTPAGTRWKLIKS